MAQTDIEIEFIFCSICYDVMKDPVTLPCGHSYCMSCIKAHWNGLLVRVLNRCPQCKKIFKKKPVLVKNAVLSEVIEKIKKTELKKENHYYAGPQDVSCDVCIGRKQRAVKSCLQCLASYCEKHLQPHGDVPPLQRHQLVEPCAILQDNICSLHNKMMEMFCHTDQHCICYLCSVDQHQGHDVTSSTAEMTKKKTELVARQQDIFQRIQSKERELKALHQEALIFRQSVNDIVLCTEECFTQLFHLLEDMRCSVVQQISSLQQSEERRVQELQDKLEQDVTELKTTKTELESLLDFQDPCLFLHKYSTVFRDRETPDVSRVYRRSESCFENVTMLLSALTNKLQLALKEGLDKMSSPPSRVKEVLSEPTDSGMRPKYLLPPPMDSQPQLGDLLTKFEDLMPKWLLQPKPEPQTREEFLRYWNEITFDPNTANTKLSLSEDNKRVTLNIEHQKYPKHTDRFSFWLQVLSTEGFTGRCYWEVEWSGDGGVFVAVVYKNIRRDGASDECGLGQNDKSWALDCGRYCYRYSFNGASSPVPGPVSSTIGVYLDHSAGLLSFYSVSQTMTLLHRVHTTFSQPLHAGVSLWYPAATVAFVNPNRKLSYPTTSVAQSKREMSQFTAIL